MAISLSGLRVCRDLRVIWVDEGVWELVRIVNSSVTRISREFFFSIGYVILYLSCHFGFSFPPFSSCNMESINRPRFYASVDFLEFAHQDKSRIYR